MERGSRFPWRHVRPRSGLEVAAAAGRCDAAKDELESAGCRSASSASRRSAGSCSPAPARRGLRQLQVALPLLRCVACAALYVASPTRPQAPSPSARRRTSARQIIRQQVNVGRQRERRRVMPKPELHLHRVQAATKQRRRARVAHRVRPRPRNPSLRTPPPSPRGRRPRRRAARRRARRTRARRPSPALLPQPPQLRASMPGASGTSRRP